MEENKEIEFQDAKVEDLREFLFDLGDSDALSKISGNIQDFQMFRWIIYNNEKIGFYEYHYLEGKDEAFFAGIYLTELENRKEEFIDEIIMKAFENASQLSRKKGAKTITINSSRKGVIGRLSDDKSCELLSAYFRRKL